MIFARTDRSSFSEPGIYHYTRSDGENKKRVHLRIDPDGYATLLINANHVFHFNPSAAFMAKAFLDERS